MHELNELIDDVLLVRYRSTGDVACVAELYTRYSHLVLGMCLKYLGSREDAEDITLEVFEVAIGKWKSEEVKNVPAWLHVVARNKCLNVLERQKRFSKFVQEKKSECPESIDESDISVEEWIHFLHTAVEELPEKQRYCLESFYFNQMSYKQIALASSLTFDEVRSHVQNGRRRLRQLMNKTA